MKYLKILLLIICCFLNVTICYAAASISVGFNNPSDGNIEDDGTDDKKTGGYTENGYRCSYEYDVNYSTSLVIDGYDSNNESIVDVKVTPTKSIKAGTSIGISIVETEGARWEDYKIELEKEVEECDYIPKYNYSCWTKPAYIRNEMVLTEAEASELCYYVIKGTQNGFKKTNCSKKFKPVSSGSMTENDKKAYEECEDALTTSIENEVKGIVGTPSYNGGGIKFFDPNDASVTTPLEEMVSHNSKCSDFNLESDEYFCKHTYTPKLVCINKLSSAVRYDNNSSSCKTDEFQIKNDIVKINGENVEHFHYFVPLNVTSGTFSLILSEQENDNNKINGDDKSWCQDVIKANEHNYFDFLIGVRDDETTFTLSDNKEIALNSIGDKGCLVRTEMKIPVSEGIYDVRGEKIKGYNLFVRNASEYNPFPNPVVNQDSLWFDWYKENYSGKDNYAYNKVAPNIKNSFDEISYYVDNIKTDVVRDINSSKGNYLKTYLNESGKSEFINDRVMFNPRSGNYYKVGCGPLNSVEKLENGDDNPLYQVGCKK